MQHTALGEQEGDQQSADAPIAAEKGMDGFELHVRECNLQQRRQTVVAVQEFSRSPGACGTSWGGGAAKLAVLSVQPGGPIQFWLVRSSRGCNRPPRALGANGARPHYTFAESLQEPIVDSALITVDPEIQSGTPVFSGTRVPIRNLFDYLEEGDSLEVFLEQFPSVSKAMAIAVLEQARVALIPDAHPA